MIPHRSLKGEINNFLFLIQKEQKDGRVVTEKAFKEME